LAVPACYLFLLELPKPDGNIAASNRVFKENPNPMKVKSEVSAPPVSRPVMMCSIFWSLVIEYRQD